MKCGMCGTVAPKGAVRCGRCRALIVGAVDVSKAAAREPLVRLDTGEPLLDELLNGGLVRGVSYRLSAEPGTGKTTLAMLLAARHGGTHFSSEQTPSELAILADRLKIQNFQVGQVESVEDITGHRPHGPLVVVDSINELETPGVSGTSGDNYQLKHAMRELTLFAQNHRIVVLALAQVNGQGRAAGPQNAGHRPGGDLFIYKLDDEVITNEGGWNKLVVKKHRFGPTGRPLWFRHARDGLVFKSDQEIKES